MKVHEYIKTSILNQHTSLLLFLGQYRLLRNWHSMGLLRDTIHIVQSHHREQEAVTLPNNYQSNTSQAGMFGFFKAFAFKSSTIKSMNMRDDKTCEVEVTLVQLYLEY
jgi:hypothetical protein